MMIRARWLTAESKVSLRVLAERMRARPFMDDSKDGFLLDRTREDLVEGRYIEKLTYQEIVPDPFGHELTFNRVAYRQVQFILHREYPQLELRDPPRGTLSFISKLSELADFSLSSAPVTINLMDWAAAITTQVGNVVTMEMIQLSEIGVSPEVTGNMVLTSRNDVRNSLAAIVGNRSYTVEKVRLTWNLSAKNVIVYLTNTGSAKVEATEADLLATLRSTLPRT